MSFILNEYQFIKISAQKNINVGYFKKVLGLINKHKNNLLDDYLPKEPEKLIGLIDTLYPWFFIILKKDDFLGFIYCHNWYGNEDKYHSCFLTAAVDRKYYGKDTRKILTLFCNYLYNTVGLVKVRVEVLKENKLCIKLLEDVRFKKEGFLKAATLKENKVKDLLIYGKINPQYLIKK